MLARVMAVVLGMGVGCVVVPAEPAGGAGPGGSGGSGGEVVAQDGHDGVVAVRSAPALECPFGPAPVPLGTDRVLRCRGLPFEVTFPDVPGTVQRTDAGGTVAMGLELIEGNEVGAVGVFARPSPMARTGELASQLDDLLGAIVERSLRVNPWTVVSRADLAYPGALAGRSLVFAATVGGGEIHAFWIEPWIVTVFVAGTPGSTLRRDGAAARAFFDSFRRVMPDGGEVEVGLPSGARIAIPGDAWLVGRRSDQGAGVLEERTYDAPSLGGILMLRDLSFGGASCQQLAASSPELIQQQLAGTTGEATVTRVEHATVAGAPAIYTEATIQTEWDRLKGHPVHPAVGYFVCSRTSVHVLLGGTSSHATQRATLDRVTASLRLPP